MNDSQQSPPESVPPRIPRRWPRAIGTIGIVLGVLILIDPLDDLLFRLFWAEPDWLRFLSPAMAELVVSVMPPLEWQLAQAAAQLALGVLLVAGSLRLRRYRRSGARLCRTWSWLAIGWIVVLAGWALWQLPLYSARITDVAGRGWQPIASFGALLALALLLAFPVFLLVWLSRPDVRAELETWEG